jgi:hypothetical protein
MITLKSLTKRKVLPFPVQQMIRRRKIARQQRERMQLQLVESADLFHSQICDKLESLGVQSYVPLGQLTDESGEEVQVGWKLRYPWLDNFFECGQHEIRRQCRCCGETKIFKKMCSQKWCPRCSWKVSKRREEKIKVWAKRIRSPLHIVLTQKNFPTLTSRKLKEHISNLQSIRRQDFFSHVDGGCITVEITNTGNGWHLHSHWLVNARSMDTEKLSIAWGKLVGQEFAIVKAKKILNTEYLSEVCKYVAKGSEIAQWKAEEIWEFATAIRNRRFFFSFGTLFKLAKEIREELQFLKPESVSCECGSHDFKFKY